MLQAMVAGFSIDDIPVLEELGNVPPHVQEFHETTRLYRRASAQFRRSVQFFNRSEAGVLAVTRGGKTYPNGRSLSFPEPQTLTSTLTEALQNRRSTRDFCDKTISKEEIFTLLCHALGSNRSMPSATSAEAIFRLRPYPAAGALFAVEFYPVFLRVEDASRAVTHFNPSSMTATLVRSAVADAELAAALGDTPALRSAALVIVQTIVMKRITQKYRERGYRFALLEAGLAAQNICLVASAMGLGSLVWGGFFDRTLDELIQVHGLEETSVNAIFVGTLPR
jgi:SagB-type dehydrogenase family enzyme